MAVVTGHAVPAPAAQPNPGAAQPTPAPAQEQIDGFQLVIEALKLNGLDTVYGLPGIPITDLTRRAQAAGLRVLSFRHEQNAGYAASIAGFLTQKPGICLTVSAPGFLNGLNSLAHATTNCFPMILISRLVGARDRGPAAGRLRGDGPARRRQAGLQGGVPRAACRGHRRGHRARHPRRGLGAPRRRVPRPARQALRAVDRRRSGPQDAHQGGRSRAAADPGAGRGEARHRPAEGREEAAHRPRQGRGLRAGRRGHQGPRREDRHSLPADVDGEGPAAGYPRAVRFRGALLRAARGRRRDARSARASTGCSRTARARPGAARPRRIGAARSSSRSTSRRSRGRQQRAASRRPWWPTSARRSPRS